MSSFIRILCKSIVFRIKEETSTMLIKMFTLLIGLICVSHSLLKAQNLTPNELMYFNQMDSGSTEREYLEKKGFVYNSAVSYTTSEEKRESWIFKISGKESAVVSYIIKV